MTGGFENISGFRKSPEGGGDRDLKAEQLEYSGIYLAAARENREELDAAQAAYEAADEALDENDTPENAAALDAALDALKKIPGSEAEDHFTMLSKSATYAEAGISREEVEDLFPHLVDRFDKNSGIDPE